MPPGRRGIFREMENERGRLLGTRLHNTVQKLVDTPPTNRDRKEQMEKTITLYILRGAKVTSGVAYMLQRQDFCLTF